MARLLGTCVALLGIASLVFGIIFVVMADSAKAEVIEGVTDEGWPTFAVTEYYPYVSVTEAAMMEGDIIDTTEDIDDALDALEEIRGNMVDTSQGAGVAGFNSLFEAKTFIPWELPEAQGGQGLVVDTLQFHEYAAVLSFTGVLGTAKAGLGVASMMQIMGIVNIIVGAALMLVGLVVFRLAHSHE